MNRKRKGREPEERLLGSIFTEIAGRSYYDAPIGPGEEARFEREPENSHDPNAIRVENPDFQPVGHVPRRIASWLAPLVDEGRVRVKGSVPEPGPSPPTGFPAASPLRIDVSITAEGRTILEPAARPRGGARALHEMVRRAWEEMGEAAEERAARELALLLEPLNTGRALPETRLLLALLPERTGEARKRERERVVAELRAHLRSVRLGDPIFVDGLTLFPLRRKNGRRPPYVLVSSALKRGTAVVEEVSDEGSVPNISVVNRGARPLLVPEGEILVGEKQNRVVNVAVLVAAAARFTLPVTCVEQGRWGRTAKRGFRSEYFSPPHLRSLKLRSVHESRNAGRGHRSDQGSIWGAVMRSLVRTDTESSTMDLTDALKKAKDRARSVRKNLALPKDACGVLAGVNGEVVGLDLFDVPSTLSHLWNRLSESYLYALFETEGGARTTKKSASEFLRRVAAAAKPTGDSLGLGTELVIEEEEVVGHGLWYEGGVRHLSAFRSKKPGKEEEIVY